MKKNVSNIDKIIRILLAAVIVILAMTHVISGAIAVILLILAGVLVLTSLISFCPIWYFLGISTRKKNVEV